MNAFVQRNPSIDQLNQIRGQSSGGLFAALLRTVSAWRQRRAAAAADRQLWATALTDHRVMAEITRAKEQHPGESRTTRLLRAS